MTYTLCAGTTISAHLRSLTNGDAVGAACYFDTKFLLPQKEFGQFICSSIGPVEEGEHNLVVVIQSVSNTAFDYFDYFTSRAPTSPMDLIFGKNDDAVRDLEKPGDTLDFTFTGMTGAALFISILNLWYFTIS